MLRRFRVLRAMSVHESTEIEESREVTVVVIVTTTYLLEEMFPVFGENRRQYDGFHERFCQSVYSKGLQIKGQASVVQLSPRIANECNAFPENRKFVRMFTGSLKCTLSSDRLI
jgi:hypothetical protein